MKMYFNNCGKSNFYVLSAEGNTLRGILVLKSKPLENSHLNDSSWNSFAAIEIELGGKPWLVSNLTCIEKNVCNVKVNYSLELSFKCSSKYFGEVSYSITISQKFQKTYEEKLNYPDSEKYQIYVKYIGAAFEEVETTLLEDNI